MSGADRKGVLQGGAVGKRLVRDTLRLAFWVISEDLDESIRETMHLVGGAHIARMSTSLLPGRTDSVTVQVRYCFPKFYLCLSVLAMRNI